MNNLQEKTVINIDESKILIGVKNKIIENYHLLRVIFRCENSFLGILESIHLK